MSMIKILESGEVKATVSAEAFVVAIVGLLEPAHQAAVIERAQELEKICKVPAIALSRIITPPPNGSMGE